MFVSRVSSTRLNPKRLDADFYRPEFLQNEEKLLTKKVSKLGDIGKFFAGPFGSLLPSSLYLDKGIPLFRVGNIGQFEVLTDNFAHLAPHVHDELKSSEVRPGDLLVVKASVGEKICKVPDWIPKANITQHIIGIRPNGIFDIDYVSAFLFSRYGVLQLQRYSLGSIIQYLGISDAKGTYIVKADPVAQKYIGNKVRQAERLRAWAMFVVEKFGAIFSAQYPPFSNYDKYKSKHFRMDVGSTFDVLTPESYPPEIGQYFRENKFITLGELSSEIFTGCTQEDAGLGEKFVFQASSRSCTGLFLRKPFNQVIQPKNGKYLKKLDILLTCGAHDKRYIGKDVSIYHDNEINLPSSKVLVVRIKENTLPSSYVHSYLKSEAGYIQWQSIVRGISAGIHPGDVARIKIPLPIGTNKWHEIFFVADESIALAGRATDVSSQLTNAAKLLVEALIEGQLTEAELIAAEQSLQAGNDQLDRRILNRLKTDGIDGQGPALFGDLDELYRLLAQAEADG